MSRVFGSQVARRGRVVSLGVTLTAALAVGLVGTFAAFGAVGSIPFLLSFGSQGSAAGQFEIPRGVAVDNSAGASKGDVYVLDQNNHRLEKLGPTGTFIWAAGLKVNETRVQEAEEGKTVSEAEENLCTATSGDACQAGTVQTGPYPVGDFSQIVGGAAVDPATGDVYVQDRNVARVEEFGPEGEPILTFGGHVNETTGGDVCTVASGDTCTAGIEGTEHGELEKVWPLGSEIAIGQSGTVFVPRADTIQEFEADGAWKGEVSLESLSASGKVSALAVDPSTEALYFKDTEAEGVHELELKAGSYVESATVYDSGSSVIKAIAVDPTNGEVFVNDKSSGELRVQRYDSTGVLQAESAAELIEESTGLGVSAAGTVYAADSENAESADKVIVLGETPAVPPAVSGESLIDGANTATVTAAVNPLGRRAEWWVEYGPTASYGGETAVSALGPVLGGERVSAVLTGLLPETEYHYRLVAKNAIGTEYGPDGTFETYGSAQSSLPDGRVYELVTPAYKNGNTLTPFAKFQFGIAEAGGEAVAYTASGAIGASTFSTESNFVSRRIPGVGWSTSQIEPRPTTPVEVYTMPTTLIPSADFKRFVFAGGTSAFTKEDLPGDVNIFLTEDPLVEPLWLGRPQIESPVPGAVVGENPAHRYFVAGGSPELGEVYFGYSGTLLPQDQGPTGREAHIGAGMSHGRRSETEPWGLYEWNHGTLEEAGELPDGGVSPFGAAPAYAGITEEGRELANQAVFQDNWLSDEGRRALFVSPDPLASSVSNPAHCAVTTECTSEPPELYLREALPGGGHRVTLVSESTLPGHEREPAAHGATEMRDESLSSDGNGSFAFASSDGSQVFFASEDFLTKAAEEAGETGPKEYDYSVEDKALTYLPEVHGSIVSVAPNGSELMFVNTAKSPEEIEVWQRASGATTPVGQLPGIGGAQAQIDRAFVSRDGGVFVLLTSSRIPGFNDGGHVTGGEEGSPLEVFRYDVAEASLSCLSCGPTGVTPIGDASIGYTSFHDTGEERLTEHRNGESAAPETSIEARGISANGRRVFFDTPNQLVAQATNGKRDVYEWEADGEGSCAAAKGCTYLISSGTSTEESHYVDNSESGNDVFFATSAGLVSQDTDGSADMYDARVPRPGDNSPPTETPCKGAVCQGPPSVPSLLSQPASLTLEGPGNLTPAGKPKQHGRRARKHHVTHRRRRSKSKHDHGAGKRRVHGSRHHNGRGK